MSPRRSVSKSQPNERILGGNYLDIHRILALLWSAWLDRGRVAVVAYLLEENRVLREQLGRRRVRLADAQRSKLVGSIRRECLDRVIPLGEQHLRRIVGQYVSHYNTERTHQGIGNRLIEPTIAANAGGAIQCRERLGGLLRFYHREAA